MNLKVGSLGYMYMICVFDKKLVFVNSDTQLNTVSMTHDHENMCSVVLVSCSSSETYSSTIVALVSCL